MISVEDLAVTGNGTWCYAVFTLDRRNRWRLAGTAHRDARHARRRWRSASAWRRRRRRRPACRCSGRTRGRRSTGVQVLRAPRRVPGRTRRRCAPYASARHDGRARDVRRRRGRAGHVVLRPAVPHGRSATRGRWSRRCRSSRAVSCPRSAGFRPILSTCPSRSGGMHIHGTRVGRQPLPAPPDADRAGAGVGRSVRDDGARSQPRACAGATRAPAPGLRARAAVHSTPPRACRRDVDSRARCA